MARRIVPTATWSLKSLCSKVTAIEITDATLERLQTLSAMRSLQPQDSVREDLNQIMYFVKHVQIVRDTHNRRANNVQVDTRGIKPLRSLTETRIPLTRSTAVTEGGCPDEVLGGAVRKEGRFFVVSNPTQTSNDQH